VPEGWVKENFIRIQRISAVVCWVLLIHAIREFLAPPSRCVVSPWDYETTITVLLWWVSIFMVSSLIARDKFGFIVGAAQTPAVICLAMSKTALEYSIA